MFFMFVRLTSPSSISIVRYTTAATKTEDTHAGLEPSTGLSMLLTSTAESEHTTADKSGLYSIPGVK